MKTDMAFGVFAAKRSRASRAAIACAVLVAMMGSAQAGTIVYTPTNPTFGGNPLNGAYLFNNAQAQNQHQPSTSTSGTGAGASLSPGQIFAQQLTSQLYSSLANKITSSIFGENAAQNGTFSFEGTTITYQRVGSNINISINDGQTITNVTVPAGP
jgi:curli production assembly/transport component CsgF